MIYAALHLHAYQPPTQPKSVINGILAESYEPVIRAVEENPCIFLSLDIAKSLGERLPPSFLLRIKNLYDKRRIALVNTAAYHYLLPLCPDWVVKRQLELNRIFYREELIRNDELTGIFLPELAFSPRLAQTILGAGFKWVLADDVPFVWKRHKLPLAFRAPQNWVAWMRGCRILLRSSLWSEKIARGEYKDGNKFAEEMLTEHKMWRLACNNTQDSYIILAMDFETFGHHHQGAIGNFLIPFFEAITEFGRECKPVSLAAIVNHFPAVPAFMPAGSWATSQEDLAQNIPYPLWNHPANPFHQAWNEFMRLVFALAPKSPEPHQLGVLLDQSFYSCSPWWAAHEGKDARGIAGWCLPKFKEIIDFLPSNLNKSRLTELYKKMEEFVES